MITSIERQIGVRKLPSRCESARICIATSQRGSTREGAAAALYGLPRLQQVFLLEASRDEPNADRNVAGRIER